MILEIISSIVISLGLLFLALGIYGIFKYKDFYTRMLVASKVDTMGFLLVMTGIGIRHGFSFFTAKLILLAIVMLVANPFVSSIVVRSAFQDNDTKHPEGSENENLPLDENEEAHNSIDGPWVASEDNYF